VWWITPVILPTQEVDFRNIVVPDQPQKNEIPSQQMTGTWWHTHVISSYVGESNRRTVAGLAIKVKSYLTNKDRWSGSSGRALA
jgi:hypothetical protein